MTKLEKSELESMKDCLKSLLLHVDNLAFNLPMFPKGLLKTNVDAFLGEVNYLTGYVDCMLNNDISLPNKYE